MSHGQEQPVNLALTASSGGFAPVNAPIHVAIGRRLADGASVEAGGLGLAMVGANVGATMSDRGVFYHDVNRDVDAVVAPTISGVEMFAVLRSPASPEVLRYHVSLPRGASLLAVNGEVQVVRGGRLIAAIPAPSAADAQGQPVPTTMTLAGSDLVLRVAHRALDRAYPILVDPWLEMGQASAPGWSFHKGTMGDEIGNPEGYKESNSGPFIANYTGYINATKGETFSAFAGAWWLYEVPGGASLSEVYWNDTMVFEPRTIRSNAWDGEIIMGCEGGIAGIEEGHSFNTPWTCSVPVKKLYVSVESNIVAEEKVEYGIKLHFYAIAVTESAAPNSGSVHFGGGNPSEPSKTQVSCGRPVNCATGNQYETQTDIAVPGHGAGLSVVRTYNSQLAVTQSSPGRFGYGWSSNYGASLALGEECNKAKVCWKTAIVHQSNGSTAAFEYLKTSWIAAGPWVESTLVKQSDGSYVFTLPDQSSLHFEATGRLLSETDRNGNTTTLSYNTEGQLTKAEEGAGRAIKFAYNTDGTVKEATGPLGTVLYSYTSGNLTQVTDLDKNVWKYEYDGSHELKLATDPLKHAVTTEYDTSHRVISQTDAMKRKTTWKYATIETGTETTVTGPNGAVSAEKFNNSALPTSITHASGTSLAATATYEYNNGNELIAVTDPNKHTTKYSYNATGDRTSETDALEHKTEWTYDSTHDVETETKPNGEKTTIKRDIHGNPETISRPAPSETTQVTSYKYDLHGDLESMTDPLKRTWTYEYDSHGDRTAEIDPEGDRRTWGYNEGSQVTSMVSPRGNVKEGEPAKYTTKYEHDALGRLLLVTDPLGHKTKYAYDAAGNLETETDANSHVTKYTYDEDNERPKVEKPNKAITETGYDSEGQVKTQTDGNKHATKYERNTLEEVTEVIDPRERKTIKEYDPAGNLTKATDAAKRITTNIYDAANRLKEVSYSDGKTPTVKYEYNGDGKLTHMTDGTGETIYTYDQLDRLTESKDGHGDVAKYEYDLANEQTKITYPNGKSVIRAFDKAGRLEKVTDWLEHATKFAYNPDSELGATTFPAGTTNEDTYAYNEADQMTEAKMRKGAEVLASLAYTRDNDGQVKTVTSKGLPGEEKPGYEYDSNNRLTKGGTTGYEYDAADNATKLGTGTYKYDSADELETGPSLKYTYNEMGQRTKTSPTTGSATTYAYNQAGNLTTVERPKEGEKAEIKDTYAYDGNGLRASQTISGTTNYLAWDVSQALPMLLIDGTNSYIYGPGGIPIEQISSGGTVSYLHHDQQGSTRLLTGSAGTVTGSTTFDAYGNKTGSTGTTTTPLGYDGQYTSSDTGLIYLRARVYDPATAQFLTVDPLVGLTRAPYDYTEDNPMNSTDPTGLWFGVDDLVASGVGFVVGGTVSTVEQVVSGNGVSLSKVGIAAASGAAGGEASLYCGPACGGAVAGGLNDLGNQVNDKGSVNGGEVVASAVLGGVFGRASGSSEGPLGWQAAASATTGFAGDWAVTGGFGSWMSLSC